MILPYNPGSLPTKQAPVAGDKISFAVEGLPPKKELSRSIRNITHPRYKAFSDLRKAASKAMGGRAWYRGSIHISLTVHAPDFPGSITRLDGYMSGILDTIDGSHGYTFTYLPIIIEDDCQVASMKSSFEQDLLSTWYEITIKFLKGNG